MGAAASLDALPYPLLGRYVRGLPEGLASWPEHRAKAAMLRQQLRVRAMVAADVVDAPAVLRALFERPPLESMWITEVEYVAASLLVADVHGLDVEGFGDFWYEVTSQLARGRLYSAMLRWVSAPRMLKTAAARWGAFHRGVTLTTGASAEGMFIDLEFPPGMIPEIMLHAYTRTWQAVIDHSRSTDARSQLVDFGQGSARWFCDGFR